MTSEHRGMQRRPMAAAAAVCGLVALVAGCRDDGRTLRAAGPSQTATISAPTAPTTSQGAVVGGPSRLPGGALHVTAPWQPGGVIDAKHTCDGTDVPPALSWSPAPAGTVEIAVTVLDETQRVHWVIAALDATATQLSEASVPLTAVQAVNSSGELGWSGPCGQPGSRHTYTVTVWYLGQQTELADGAAAADLLTVIRATAIASAQTTGSYSRP